MGLREPKISLNALLNKSSESEKSRFATFFVPEHKKRNFILVPNLTKSAMESIKKDEPKKKRIVIMKLKLDRYSLRIGRIKLYTEGKKRL